MADAQALTVERKDRAANGAGGEPWEPCRPCHDSGLVLADVVEELLRRLDDGSLPMERVQVVRHGLEDYGFAPCPFCPRGLDELHGTAKRHCVVSSDLQTEQLAREHGRQLLRKIKTVVPRTPEHASYLQRLQRSCEARLRVGEQESRRYLLTGTVKRRKEFELGAPGKWILYRFRPPTHRRPRQARRRRGPRASRAPPGAGVDPERPHVGHAPAGAA